MFVGPDYLFAFMQIGNLNNNSGQYFDSNHWPTEIADFLSK
jgi:hypothetical protein